MLCGVHYLCVAIDTDIMLVLNTYLVCLCFQYNYNDAHPLQGDSYDVDMIVRRSPTKLLIALVSLKLILVLCSNSL